MIEQRVRKVGNSFVVTIPKEEMERLELVEGQLVSLDITPMEVRPVLIPELRKALLEHWDKDEEAYHYLATH